MFSSPTKFSHRIKKFLRNLGPGLVTGASDDDPSGIATYSQAGAKFGTQLLWTALLTYPLMVSMQEMCARIGLVTGHGLTGVIKRYFPRWVLYFILLLSFPSITLNIAADIAGMGAVGNLLLPVVPSWIFSVVFMAVLMYAVVFWNYKRISLVLKWLCITLFSYVLIPFLIHLNWKDVLFNSFIPTFKNTADYFLMLVGILGTTISPYLFFWQANMEVEELQAKKIVVDKKIMNDMEDDVRGGLVITNLVFYFIILTTGTVLFNSGIHNINSVDEAAQALKPLAGNFAYALFALGVLGTGTLAIPVLGGSLSYMMAETFDWQEGLNKKFHEARGFYVTLIVSMVLGLLVLFLKINPITVLIYTAVLYGLTAPVLILLLLIICNNKKIMGQYVNTRWNNIVGVITLLVMTVAAVALMWFSIH